MSTPCVMLAAGQSERMGQWKMSMPWTKHTIIEHSIINARDAGLEVTVVSGCRADELNNLLSAGKSSAAAANVKAKDFSIVHAEAWECGMFASAREGFKAVSSAGAPEWCFLALGDMPLVPPAIYQRLAEFAVHGSAYKSVIPQFCGKKGHPVLLNAEALQYALSLTDADSMRDVISAFPSLILPVEEQGVLNDIDTPDDYRIHHAAQLNR